MNTLPYVPLGKWISILSRYGQMFMTRNLRPYEVGPGQLPVLMTLYDQDGVSLDTLSKVIVVDKATTTRAVLTLEESGLVTRVTDTLDRRVKRVFLTEKARQIKPDIIQTLGVWADVLTSPLTEEETISLITMLEKVAAAAVEHLNHQEPADPPPESKELKL
ncbi:MarR family transcriptional regulator [Tumebacillus sp. DT12]|uniref:MarR family transcriptional regulator n=1 Tax=Tumebacillus lacus TaxID=2995335 RepID=A0ABT3X4N1_9BACL|nr:MarR family transcriptional regulator [Tumebacillus lacus]MCX7571861.1 MarR family transcriptional regulator [Tumebacillus lacus]